MIKKFIKKYFFLLPSRFLYLISARMFPLSDRYGLDRGKAIDRFYIEKFLENNKASVRGTCLELLDNAYTLKYGSNVSRSDILDINKNNPKANIIADLRDLKNIGNNIYDCIILTQVLQFIDAPEKALRECMRILKKGGVILATMPSMSRIDCRAGAEADYWRFTAAGAKYLFETSCPNASISVTSYGNVLVGLGFWIGMSQDEISKSKLEVHDENFPCLISVRVTKQ